MQVVVVGSAAREHALVLKLAQSSHVGKIHVIPGNAGIEVADRKVKICADLGKSIYDVAKYCENLKANLVVVGPGVPLTNGLADELIKLKIPCFGPTKDAAQIESNKSWSKEFMARHKIPTAKFASFTDSSKASQFIRSESDFKHGYVIKASGMALGRGVLIAKDKEEACKVASQILDEQSFGEAGKTIVIEEFIVGEECSVFAFTDGTNVSLMPTAQDHKRLLEGDLGPMTGGMGAICPLDLVESDNKLKETIQTTVIQRCVDGLREEGYPFVGCLYAGLMITDKREVRVLEFNCRFGDPEAQSVLPLLRTDLFQVMDACACGVLDKLELSWITSSLYICGIVIADGEYPDSSSGVQLISGLPKPTTAIEFANPCPGRIYVLHGATRIRPSPDGSVEFETTDGGRILTVIGCESSLQNAQKLALQQVVKIHIEKSRYRTDIAARAIKQTIR